MSQMILGLSGRKQSGKNTTFNFILGLHMLRLAVTRDKMMIKPNGQLWISDIFGDEAYQGVFDIERQNETMTNFCAEYIWPFIKNYSFAHMLKQNVCIDVLGLNHEQCFGTDEQKNSPTHLKWEDMPGVVTKEPPADAKVVEGRMGYYYSIGYHVPVVYHKAGTMTAREVMQFVGTEVFRKMYRNVWPNATIKKIQREDSAFAIITDCRFPNEVEAIRKAGGKVIRFTRRVDDPDNPEMHESESALDADRFDWSKFDGVVDNKDMLISQQNEAVYNYLEKWGWLDGVNKTEVFAEQVA